MEGKLNQGISFIHPRMDTNPLGHPEVARIAKVASWDRLWKDSGMKSFPKTIVDKPMVSPLVSLCSSAKDSHQVALASLD